MKNFRFSLLTAHLARNGTRAIATVLCGLLTTPALAQNQDDRARLDDIARGAAQRFVAARAEAEAAGQTRPTAAPLPAGGIWSLRSNVLTLRPST
jgi:hypothetical protein